MEKHQRIATDVVERILSGAIIVDGLVGINLLEGVP
jgi:hypothetical protein